MAAPIFKTLDQLEHDRYYIAVYDNGSITEYSNGIFHPRLGGVQITNGVLFEIYSSGKSGTLNYFHQFSMENKTNICQKYFNTTIFLPVDSKESLRDYLNVRTNLYRQLIQSIHCGRLTPLHI